MSKVSQDREFELLLAETGLDVQCDRSDSTFAQFVHPFTRQLDYEASVEETVSVQSEAGTYSLCSASESNPIFRADIYEDFLLLFDRFLIDRFLSWVPDSTLLVHAAAFEDSGTVLGFPGRPGAGKTTLSGYLLDRTDWTFLSDEILAIDPEQGRVFPFPHPLNLNDSPRSNSLRVLELRDSGGKKFFYGLPSEHRYRNRSLPVDSICFVELNRDPSSRSKLEALSTGIGLQRLSYHSMRPEEPARRFQRTMDLDKFDIQFHRLYYDDLANVDFDGLRGLSA